MEELKRIMHIEDDDSIRMITSITLESVGNFELLSCEGGQEALDKFDGFQPQAILLDVMMPGMDGPETLEKLKEQFGLDNVMVIFMTAKVQQEELEHFKSIGGFDVIEKPFDPMALTDKIKTCWQAYSGD